MDPESTIEEIMFRVKKLEIKARRKVKETFTGEYASTFRGQGLEFDDYREYQHGDEVRFIDWNVTARLNQTFIRKFKEERERNVILAVDVSASNAYGSENWSKREKLAEVAAMLGFSALQSGDKVGCVLFSDEVVQWIAPEKSKQHLLRQLREILSAPHRSKPTCFKPLSTYLLNMLKRQSLVFILSDFFADQLQSPLQNIARRHETVAIQMLDPLELQLPKIGKLPLIDPETQDIVWIDTSHPSFRKEYETMMKSEHDTLLHWFKTNKIDHARILTNEDVYASLRDLMRRRSPQGKRA